MPYAAKATVQHEFITDHIELYLTFDHPMLRTRDPLAAPPVFDVMPPLTKWLLDCDSVDTDVTASTWIDEFTLKLTSDTLTTAPADVELEYDGPDDDLCYKWGKRFEPWGPIPSTELPAVDPTPIANRYPTHATLWHDESTSLVGAVWAHTLFPAQRYNTFTMKATHANGDAFQQTFFLKAGTYTFSVLGRTTGGSGKIDWYIDNVKVVSLQDWFYGGELSNIIKTASSISVVGNGLHTLKGIINGKNVSSEDYAMLLTKYWFTVR
jgi:hypothetical protein